MCCVLGVFRSEITIETLDGNELIQGQCVEREKNQGQNPGGWTPRFKRHSKELTAKDPVWGGPDIGIM